jgi:hypothetical protein
MKVLKSMPRQEQVAVIRWTEDYLTLAVLLVQRHSPTVAVFLSPVSETAESESVKPPSTRNSDFAPESASTSDKSDALTAS